MSFNTISVLGLGYVGLPTAALFASKRVRVIGVDCNPDIPAAIARGKIHIVEPDLEGLVQKVVGDGYLVATTAPQPADAFIIAVPTPLQNGMVPDTSYVESAARNIGPVLQKNNLVVIESTCPVGTTEFVASVLARLRPDLRFPQDGGSNCDVDIAYCPERVLPGRVLTELVHNDRSIGGLSERSGRRAADLYRIFLQAECRITEARTAEMVKLAENAYRDVNIAFANELSLICDKLAIDVWDVIRLANHHPRVEVLQPGPGVGGHCIAIDPWFIIDAAPEEARLLRAARAVNDGKPSWVIGKVRAALKGLRSDAVIACLGLAYKANVDDLRESPAVEITMALAAEFGRRVVAVEPFIARPPQSLIRIGAGFTDVRSAIRMSDIVVLLVDHAQFYSISSDDLAGKIVIDTRGVWRRRPA